MQGTVMKEKQHNGERTNGEQNQRKAGTTRILQETRQQEQ